MYMYMCMCVCMYVTCAYMHVCMCIYRLETHIPPPQTPNKKQVAHYFHCYLRLTDPSTQKIRFVVPTGAAGHVTAGVIACLMGLPAEGLVMATNEVCDWGWCICID